MATTSIAAEASATPRGPATTGPRGVAARLGAVRTEAGEVGAFLRRDPPGDY